MSILSLIGILLLVGFFAIVEIVDWAGRLDFIEHKWPTAWRFLNNRVARFTLLLICFVYLARDFKAEIPPIPSVTMNVSPPPAPEIQLPPKQPSIVAAVDRLGPIDRFMNTEQKDRLYQELKQLGASQHMAKEYTTVTIVPAYRHDRESSRLALQLASVFQDAGWSVVDGKVKDYESPTFQGQIPIGIWVSSTNNMDIAVELSLINAGVQADTVPKEKLLDPSFSGILVLVGYKAAPF
jgi:hypothetical protein